MGRVNDNSYKSFENIFLNALNIYTPLKTKLPRFNNRAFMTKKLRKEIMRRSKLKNNFNKNRNYENWCKFKTQKLKVTSFRNSSDADKNQITSVFKDHVSIRKIQEYFPNMEANNFNFRQVPVKKSSTNVFLSATILKQSVDVYLPFLTFS